MKKLYINYLVISTLITTLVSCENLLIKPDPANTPTNNFELLWKEVNERYTFFEYKNIDWDASYRKYRPLVNDNMNEQELFNVMADMMNDLRDGHTNLISDFDVSRNYSWYLDYPQNFNSTIIERNYLGKDYQRTGPFKNRLLNNNIAYIQYESFLNLGDSTHLNILMDKYRNTQGMIIDIRDNTGGALLMVNTIAAHFVPEDMTLAYERYKKGSGRDNFGKFYPFFVKKATKTYNGKVVILTNRQVYSAANMFASVMGELPNITLIGDQTGGGGGAPFSGELLNGWTYRFSGNQLVNLRQEQIENGIMPDVKVDLLPTDEANGKDTILETALQFLK